MATQQEVKTYLAYWVQLGKGIYLSGSDTPCRPNPVVKGDRFSETFERCWAKVQASKGKGCHLEGTDVTLDQLFSSEWEIDSCARCGMAVPTPVVIYNGLMCPCNDVSDWPNDNVPRPRLPQSDRTHLSRISERLVERHAEATSR